MNTSLQTILLTLSLFSFESVALWEEILSSEDILKQAENNRLDSISVDTGPIQQKSKNELSISSHKATLSNEKSESVNNIVCKDVFIFYFD